MFRSPRRYLVRGLLAASAAAALVAIAPSATPAAADSSADRLAERHDAWLGPLKGKHRQLFDSPAPTGGITLVHILNYYDTYSRAYNVAGADVNAIGTFYGATTFYGLNDAMWAKYRLGEFLEAAGADGAPATVNPWRTAPQVLGMTIPQASIVSLQNRGATFLICNNALEFLSGVLARQRGLEAKAVYQEMKANILPGVNLVPAMVIAIEKAQTAGFTYHRQ